MNNSIFWDSFVHQISESFFQTLSNGLRRAAVTTCSKWASSYRVMGNPYPGPFSFVHHPWSREMHDSKAPINYGQKGAQLGYTETLLNIAFYKIDIEKIDCLYVLPAKTPDASDFSSSRFDAALELSPHLANLFSDVKNIGHKRAGSVNLYIRGSKSRAGLKSIPVGAIFFDELDEMEQENLPLALERTAGQRTSLIWGISTPTAPGVGINQLYMESSQEHFFFPCPHCSVFTELIFPDSLIITADSPNDPKINDTHLVCKECRKVLPHHEKPSYLTKGQWVAANPTNQIRGFHVNQLYSSTIHPAKIAIEYLKCSISPAVEQEFFNSKLGLPHLTDGAKIEDKQIDACLSNYSTYPSSSSLGIANPIITLGVDVGRWLHYEILQWNLTDFKGDVNASATCRILKASKCASFEELQNLMRTYQVRHCVIDANPERRKAFEFAKAFYGFVSLCIYGRGVNGKQLSRNDEECRVTVDRASWLDLSLSRFGNRTISLPRDISSEYRDHLKNIIRIYKNDDYGNPVPVYISKGDDHFAHAHNYAEIALPLAVSVGVTKTIR